jgi:hypothetical protein
MPFLTSMKFADKAAEVLGLEIKTIRRITIDAIAGEPVKVYVECFTDERWLDVLTPDIQSAQIILGKPEE